MTWNCDEYFISYNRPNKILTVEETGDFDEETGDLSTTVITDPSQIDAVLDQYEPGWIGLDGFVFLKKHYADRWTIGSKPV